MTKPFERRAIGQSRLQIRKVDGTPTQIIGYAATFNTPAHGEVIRPGAFTKTLQEQQDIKAFWNHDSSMVLGRTSNETLKLRQDTKGLYCEITPNPETSWGRDALAAVARGDVKGMSFGFRIIKAGIATENGEDLHELLELDLREVSPCGDPWYESTEAAVRNVQTGASLEARRRRLQLIKMRA